MSEGEVDGVMERELKRNGGDGQRVRWVVWKGRVREAVIGKSVG